MNVGPAVESDKKRNLLLGLLLLCAFLVYSNTLFNGFVYDDHFQIDGNPYVHGFRYLSRIFTTTVWSFQGAEGQTNHYRPLMTLGYLLCNLLFKGYPLGFHLVNVLLNCVVVWLVFAVCATLFADKAVALLSAALFALHPIHSEAVAWVAAVTELELAIFYLLTFLFFLRLDKEEGKQRAVTMLLMSASFVLALLSKEQAVTLPLLAVVYEYGYRADRGEIGWTRKTWRLAPFWLIAATYAVCRLAFLRVSAPSAGRAELTPLEVILSAVALVGQYVAKIFWPHPLLGFYVFQESRGLGDRRVLVGLLVLLVSSVLFAFLWKRARLYSFGLVWMAVTLLPVLNARWMAANVFAERYLYLPSLGFCALVAGGSMWLWRGTRNLRWARWAGASAALVFAALATAQIVARNRDWRDDKTFLTATLAIEPHASYMRTSLGALEWSERRPDDAVRDWRTAIADKPDNALALSNLGMAMLEEKRWPEAEAYLRRAIEARPQLTAPHLHLAKMYLELGKPADAESQLRLAVEMSPLNAQARNRLAEFYVQQKRFQEAEAHYRASLDGSPTSEAWSGLGDLLLRRGMQDEAASSWQKALVLDPFDEHAHLALGGAYQARGKSADAEKEYRAVLLLDPHNSDALKAMRKLKPAVSPER